MKGIADTGFVVAFLNARDRHHSWAVRLAEQISAPLLTCEAVIAETVFHTKSATLVLSLVELRLLELSFDFQSNYAHLQRLAKQFADREADFADLCIIRMSEIYPKRPIITTDRKDFSVYRKNKREVIELITP